MFNGSRFCARCGAGAKREVVEGAPALSCPRCRSDMQALKLGETEVQECGACGGLWLDPTSLQRLSDARESHADVISALATRLPANAVAPEVVRYVPCPSCAKLMNRTNFAKSSGIVLDTCKDHGVWLDRGELERVLTFVSAGGLARAREREQEQLVEERRRLTALQDNPGSAAAGAVVFNTTQDLPEDDVATSLLARIFVDAAGLFIGSRLR
jgi:Uncharacterized protein conserved in bacteria